MTVKIFKYKIELIGKQEIELPYGARILSVINQQGNIVLYALIDPELPVIHTHEIRIIGTGNEVTFETSDYTFLGTVSIIRGELIWHVFYKSN